MTNRRSLKYSKYSRKGIFCVFIFWPSFNHTRDSLKKIESDKKELFEIAHRFIIFQSKIERNKTIFRQAQNRATKKI